MASDPAAVAAFRERRQEIDELIAAAASRSGRPASDVTLVAVSKTVDGARVQAAVDAGFDLLGENRVQEAESKAPQVRGGRWHLIGPLQSNKARRAVELFDVLETVDSVELARRLDRVTAELGRRRTQIYLQVNVDRDPHKAGFDPSQMPVVLPEILAMPGLSVLGLMTVGRLVDTPEEARPTFAALRRLSEELRADHPDLGPGLSMGMSDDFAVAIEEGATVVRVGRAILGVLPQAL